MEMVRGENLTVLEEEVYQTRSNRLLDLGIIPSIEAKEIYSYIEPEAFNPGGKSDFHLEADNLKSPAALLACAEPHNLLAELLNHGLKHDIASELLLLANRKMSADNVDISDIDNVTETLQTTYDTLNLALEFLAGSDSDKARTIFNNTYLLHLFQLGSSLIKKRQRKGKEIAGSLIYPFLDYPELLFVDSLVLNPPGLYQEDDPGVSSSLQPLISMDILSHIDRRLIQIEALQRLFTQDLPFKFQPQDQLTENHPTLSGIFLTAVANQLLGREFTPALLPRDDIPRLKDKTFSDGELSESFCFEISQSMQEIAPDCDFFTQFCLDIWKQIFQNAESQVDDNPIFTTLLVAPKKG